MKRVAYLLAPVAISLTSVLVFGPAPAADADDAGSSTTWTGEYHWDQGGASGDLKAVFEPTGDGTWDVSFYFDFRSRPHTYSGTATGSLTDGALSGEVKTENKRRTFTFEGKVEDGEFSGDHAETTRGEPLRTGTLSLSR